MPAGVEELFPLKPRPGQIEVAEKLAELLEQRLRIVFSAPTGWGKTLVALTALKAANALPALWLVRSLELGRRVAEDAALLRLTTFTAAGRERTCPLADKLGEAVHDFCRLHKHKCPYFRPPPALDPTLTSWEQVVEAGRREGWCPYYAQDLVEADVLVQSYNRRARRAVAAAVYDEAHNLLLPEERSYSISRIAEAIAAARGLVSQQVMKKLEALYGYLLAREGSVDPSLHLSEEERSELRWAFWRAEPELMRSLKPLVDVAAAPIAYAEGERVVLFKPRLPLPFRPAVFVSATIPQFAHELLRTEAEIRVPWAAKPKATLVKSVTTRYEDFSIKMALEYKKILLETAKRHKRVLVFAASERVARELRKWATYEEVLPPPDWEGVLLLRARGRFAEGVDLPADAVVMAGAPYLPPEVSDRLARAYRAAGVPDPVRAAIDLPMLTATLQCIGRAWRDPERPPSVVLADWRYERYAKDLEPYLELTGDA